MAQVISSAETDNIRKHARTGRPLGDMNFVSDLERLLGRKLRPGIPGRKPEEENDLVAKRKKKGPSWSDVKAKLINLNKKQLLNLVADLYRLSKENETFLNSRFDVGDNPLGPYKKIIEECMHPDIYSKKPIQVSKAKKAISSYSKAVGDPVGQAELMTYFVECGNKFTVNFGDIDGPFYDALNRMYRRTISKVLTLPEERQDEYKDRLEAIMSSSSSIGWGYHDMLCDDYYEAFPEAD